MGPMGGSAGRTSLRGMVLHRVASVVRLKPGEVLVEKGKPVGGLFYPSGAGRLELGNLTAAKRRALKGELGPGDFLEFQLHKILSAGAAHDRSARRRRPALLMAADRHDVSR